MGVLFAFFGPTCGLAREGPLFSVRFGTEAIEFCGVIDSADTIGRLTAELKTARPDLRIVTEELTFDSSNSFGHAGEIKSLLAEIAFSTHEGIFELWPDRVVIGGLSDSLVTPAALRIRVQPILGGRTLVSRVCIVDTADLPAVGPPLNSDGSAPLIAAATAPRKGPSYEVPGILLEKLLPTILMLSEFDRLENSINPTGSPMLATPIEEQSDSRMPDTKLVTATPIQQYDTLPSVSFSRNATILQTNQGIVLDEIAKRLLAPDRLGAPVVIEAVVPGEGSTTLNDYLCERRNEEIVRLLRERGIAEEILTTTTVRSSTMVDVGEVRLRVEIPLPPSDDPQSENAPEPSDSPVTVGANP